MYFKNSFGKVYVEDGKLYVDTSQCTIIIEPKTDSDQFLEDEFEFHVANLQLANLVLPPKNKS